MRSGFSGAQVNLYCDDVEECAEFYRRLGFAERFRTPSKGVPSMVEVSGPAFTIGLARATAAARCGGSSGQARAAIGSLSYSRVN